MPSLHQMIGNEIFAFIPAFDRDSCISMVLLAVEPAGIWVESQKFTDRLFERSKNRRTDAMPQPSFFIPFFQVVYVLGCSLPTDIASNPLAFVQ